MYLIYLLSPDHAFVLSQCTPFPHRTSAIRTYGTSAEEEEEEESSRGGDRIGASGEPRTAASRRFRNRRFGFDAVGGQEAQLAQRCALLIHLAIAKSSLRGMLALSAGIIGCLNREQSAT